MTLKELNKLPIGIIGKIETMNITKKIAEEMFEQWENIKDATEKYGDWDVIQIFGITKSINEGIDGAIEIVIAHPIKVTQA